MLRKQPIRFRSLRSYYVALAVLLALIVAMVVWATQSYVASASRDQQSSLGHRYQAEQLNRLIRDTMWDLEYYLQLYMISPNEPYRDQVREQVKMAIDYSGVLLNAPWGNEAQTHPEILAMQTDLQTFQANVEELMTIRNDVELLYPALKIARGELVQIHNRFQTQLSLALTELNEENPRTITPSHKLFYDIRHAWLSMISSFRMLLINRLATLFLEGVDNVNADIRLQHQEVMNELEQLQQMGERDELGLQAIDAVDRMQALATDWLSTYDKVYAFHTSNNWRNDIPYIQSKIQPLLVRIQSSLKDLQSRIEEGDTRDIINMTQTTRDITHTLWLMGLVFMALILVSYYFFSGKLLKPIELVSSALKQVAHGNRQPQEIGLTSTTEIQSLVDAFQEMSRQVHSRQEALEYQAMHDALTDLPNRLLLYDRMNQFIETSRRHDSPFSLIMIDLNRFKELNDTLGHHVGDKLLKHVGQRLARMLRSSDTVARLGGDEFAILLPNVSRSHVMETANKILNEIEKVYNLEGKSIYIGASLGIANFPEHGETPQMLLQHADVAMYMAKQSNTGIAVYDPDKDQSNISNLALLGDLRKAIDDDALSLCYQPKVSLSDETVTSFESLLRWHHPERGIIHPDLLIPLAERSGLIKSLTLWVLNHSLQQLKQWQQASPELKISVNLSVWDLQNASLDSRIKELLDAWNMPADVLELEITESDMMIDPDRAQNTLKRLDKMGVSLAIDDYGTGFSSLAYLKSLPVDTIKIDKSFIMNMTQDENDAVIVRSTIDLAHSLGFRVTAEGVENADTLQLLKNLGCDTVQGYFISTPMTAEQVARWEGYPGNERAALGLPGV